MRLPLDPDEVKGFLDPAEGHALFEAARREGTRGPALEIGSYCGKSALYLGTGMREAGSVLFAVDHHRGSDENQPGWSYHDPELWDAEAGALDTLPHLRRTLRRAGLEGTVIPVVGRAETLGRYWRLPLSLLFIDGGHSSAQALSDYRLWTMHLLPRGLLAIHDVFPDPKDGGRPPFEIYCLALASGLFAEEAAVKSLRFLRRLG